MWRDRSRRPADSPPRAQDRCGRADRRPTLTVKKITPPVLRHTEVMRLLTTGIDSTVIAFLEAL